jgi:DAK2 domain fusion protein YloV
VKSELTAADIKDIIKNCAAALEAECDEINALNVFPVPDGDTGTNMFLTMQSVIEEMNGIREDVKAYATAIKDGSLKGARGNSGVILSQILRGISDVIIEGEVLDAGLITRALNQGSRVAYEAVMKPVEGTMLTVIKDMAKAARKAARRSDDIVAIMQEVVKEADESVVRTPDLLDVLKEAGVVDAGGRGIAVMAGSALAALTGEKVAVRAVSKETMIQSFEDQVIDLTYLNCTEFLLKSDTIDVDKFKKSIRGLGDSMLVVGGGGMYRTHIHTNDPGKVLARATQQGELSQIKINNMKEQSEERAASLKEVKEIKEIAVVAVAAGEGIKRILRSLGVTGIVNGGQTMNPSAADIAGGIDSSRSGKVIVLPNNKNIILTAQQASDLTKKEVSVIPTRSIPEAFAALLAFEPEKSLKENQRAMDAAFKAVKTGEVTRASRDSKARIGDIRKGDTIGIYDSDIVTAGKDIIETGEALIRTMLDKDSEVLTILTGDGLRPDDMLELRAKLQKEYPDMEVEIHDGGQPLYPLIVGVE